jgi:alpha-mannosidase
MMGKQNRPATEDTTGQVFAKMPYDILQRPREDVNYFGREIPADIQPLLLAARELGSVKDFPFQGFVAIGRADRTRAILARGLREYEVDSAGTIAVTLRRAVQWLAKSDLNTRVGDAGPYMYTPGARDQRRARFELSFMDLARSPQSETFLKWFYWFEYGYIGFENRGYDGTQDSKLIWTERLPWSGIQTVAQGKHIIRVYNPMNEVVPLAQPHTGSDPFGENEDKITELGPKQVAQLAFGDVYGNHGEASPAVDVELTIWPPWPTDNDTHPPQTERLEELRKKIKLFETEQAETRDALVRLDPKGDPLAYHRMRHKVVRLDREILELELSLLLNHLKFHALAEKDPERLQDKIRDFGRRTNLARRNRRTYDYILSLFENP